MNIVTRIVLCLTFITGIAKSSTSITTNINDKNHQQYSLLNLPNEVLVDILNITESNNIKNLSICNKRLFELSHHYGANRYFDLNKLLSIYPILKYSNNGDENDSNRKKKP